MIEFLYCLSTYTRSFARNLTCSLKHNILCFLKSWYRNVFHPRHWRLDGTGTVSWWQLPDFCSSWCTKTEPELVFMMFCSNRFWFWNWNHEEEMCLMSNAFTDVLSPDVGIKLLWANVLVLFLAEICPLESLKCSRYFFFKPVSNPIHKSH